jgi:ADP-heptose:LPS heptosyltransferase/glycosyltransferase involved in cell wall biosynthesis
MSDVGVSVSLVVSTLGRTTVLSRLMDSLVKQDFKDFEVIVVDQNRDDRIVPIIDRYKSCLAIKRISTPERRGISAGRNDGWRCARGDIVAFPDDDCWYPSWFLRKGIGLLETTGAELVSGRIADEYGRSINGRYASRPSYITRRSVWITQAEAATLYKRVLLEQLGGFDETLGLGSSAQWQAAEGPHLILAALEKGLVCYFDPSLYGFHHEYDLNSPAEGMAKKGRMYGRGMGFVLRQHRYGILSIIYWASRPLGTALISLICGKTYRAEYAISVAIGRVEGWTRHLWSVNQGLNNIPSVASSRTGPEVFQQDSGVAASFGQKRREMTGAYNARNTLLVASLWGIDLFARLLPKVSGTTFEKNNKQLRVLVANWGHLGDVVTILPLLNYLKHHPQIKQLGVLVGSGSRVVLESSDVGAQLHIIDHWALKRTRSSTIRKMIDYFVQRSAAIAEINRFQYDISIDTFSSFPSTHWITRSALIPRRIGFKSGGLGPLLTDAFNWIPSDESILDHQLKLLEPILGAEAPKHLSACYPGFNVALPAQMGEAAQRPYVVIHMGLQDFKGWPAEKWILLAKRLVNEGYDLVVTGAAGREAEVARDLARGVPVHDLSGQLSWAQFVSVVARAAAVVTIDSVTGHLAACFNTPVAVITTGRTRLSLWRPNSSTSEMLMQAVSCAPCNRTRGCEAMACVRQIAVEDVITSLEKLMRSEPVRN